ncbi:hypothetical protein H5410_015351 [Solanum commersonii]|uniref:Uncharacterized protein n=1 Tax=Solanum commersonii TaxID=4109 RepID=A0A9J5ZU76_SOLCO|nr:hypothetical protein H5410_015351 [Solanum commersonii]
MNLWIENTGVDKSNNQQIMVSKKLAESLEERDTALINELPSALFWDVMVNKNGKTFGSSLV